MEVIHHPGGVRIKEATPRRPMPEVGGIAVVGRRRLVACARSRRGLVVSWQVRVVGQRWGPSVASFGVTRQSSSDGHRRRPPVVVVVR